MAEQKLLHVYSPYAHHDDAVIVGNKEALIRLGGLIERAIHHGIAKSDTMMVADGEGFTLRVVLLDEQFVGGETWQQLMVPYRADYCKEQREKFLNPEQLYVEKEQG